VYSDTIQQVPDWLKAAPRWLLWTGKKQPISAINRRPVGWQHPDAWASFDTALAAYNPSHHGGLSFVLGDGFVGVDFDACRHPDGTLADWATRWLHTLPADVWAEVSPSGTGIKVIARCEVQFPACNVKLPFPGIGGKSAGLEVYSSLRQFCITGQGVPYAK
jgi:primase-polymerase (primpol)-like protein